MPSDVNDKPDWACDRWGSWEHDWLDCPECVERYEEWMNEPEENPVG